MKFNSMIVGAALGAALMAAPAAASTQVFAWDFETGAPTLGPFPVGGFSGDVGGGAIDGSEALPGFGDRYFHNATSGLSFLSLTGLGAHTSLTLTFDLAFIDTWDGNDDTAICCNPDYLFVTGDGSPLLTLSSNNQQGLAPQYQGGTVIGSGDYAVSAGFTDTVVRYNLTFAHSAPTFTFGLQAGGAGWQGDFNPMDESWGIDNVTISAGAVPEPATWAMMVIGFGGMGALLRRRKLAVV